MNQWIILITSFITMGILFAVAWFTDKHVNKIKWLISSSLVYSLSLTVFVTGVTFYGMVGWAAKYGISYLAIYLGATLAAALFWIIQRKMIRISKTYRITSIADFISSRYGKSTFISGIIALFFLAAIIPYISMQFRDIADNYELLVSVSGSNAGMFRDTVFFVAILFAVFTIIFGTRNLDASEKHEGVVAAVAFQSILKLIIFMAGCVVILFYNNIDFISLMDSGKNEALSLFVIQEESKTGWIAVMFVSLASITVMPHMFQVSVIENDKENNLRKASWIFPLYLLLINLFIVPVAIYGKHIIPGNINVETFFLKLINLQGSGFLTLSIFIGGLLAAASVSILALISLSTMISNNLFMPIMLKSSKFSNIRDLSGITLLIRRSSIIVMVLLAYVYFKLVGQYNESITIKIVSFAAVSQLTPAMFGGLFWEMGNKKGVLTGLFVGMGIWAYTLIFPYFIDIGFFPHSILENGLFGFSVLQPRRLFGLLGMDNFANGIFWSLFFNWGFYFLISIITESSELECSQARRFVQIYNQDDENWQNRSARTEDIVNILSRILGEERAREAIEDYRLEHKIEDVDKAEESLIRYAENLLAGAIGGASAKVLLQKVVREKSFAVEDILEILDESKQAKEYTIELEDKSRELEHTAYELHDALREMNLLKQQQDGDYFLTSLLQKPLGKNDILPDEPVKVDFYIKQNKSFRFKKWHAEIGGDYCSASTMKLKKKTFTVFINADAMGKSIQGAGGAIVLASVFQSILNRTTLLESSRDLYPEQWLKLCFLELQKVFEAFSGSMTVSAVVGILDNKTGVMYYINAEHPFPILYRKGHAEFLPDEIMMRKIGMPDLPGSIIVNCFQLLPGDMIFVGSDGKDDISFGGEKVKGRTMNEDERLFLRITEKANGNIQEIYKLVKENGEITDDFSILKLEYSKEDMTIEEKKKELKTINLVKSSRKETERRKANAMLVAELEKYPFNLNLIRELGVLSYQQKNYPQALLYFEEYIFRRPADENALFYASVCYKKIKEYAKAAELGERIRIRKPGFINNLLNLAEIYLQMNLYDRGLMITNIILAKEENQPEALRLKERLTAKTEN